MSQRHQDNSETWGSGRAWLVHFPSGCHQARGAAMPQVGFDYQICHVQFGKIDTVNWGGEEA